jgi:hypothetical protein
METGLQMRNSLVCGFGGRVQIISHSAYARRGGTAGEPDPNLFQRNSAGAQAEDAEAQNRKDF